MAASKNKGDRTSKSEQTRERLYAAALHLFETRGFDKTTMRAVAQRAGLSLGSSYYYFRSKDEIVLEFYVRLQRESETALTRLRAESEVFERRLRDFIDHRLRSFETRRGFIVVLFRHGMQPESPLSPFGKSTAALRARGIEEFRLLLEGTAVARSGGPLARHVPALLWLYQMAILLFWLYDASPGAARTRALLGATSKLIPRLLGLTRLPLGRGLARSVAGLLDEYAPAALE